MLRLNILLLLLLTSWACGSNDIQPLDREHTDAELFYLNDAKILALRHIQSSGDHPARDNIKIDKEYYSPYLEDLTAVFNLNPSNTRDLIIEKNIHATQLNNGLQLTLLADWTDAWANHELLTGNETVDNLISEYDLKVSDYTIGAYDRALIQSNDILNWKPLKVLFEEVEGVVEVALATSAHPELFSEDIKHIQSTDYSELIFNQAYTYQQILESDHEDFSWGFKVTSGVASVIDCTPVYDIGVTKELPQSTPYDLLEATISENCLEIKVGNSGCNRYPFDLIWKPIYADCCPATTAVFLITTHEQQVCKAYFQQELNFNISTLRDNPKQNGTLMIQLINPSNKAQSVQLEYRY